MNGSNLPYEVTPAEVKRLLDAGHNLKLIDVREPKEHQAARIDGAELVPMRSVPSRLPDLEAHAENATLVVFCHHGVRSFQVASWLREQGVQRCVSMAGGIDRWSCEVDPSVPRYY